MADTSGRWVTADYKAASQGRGCVYRVGENRPAFTWILTVHVSFMFILDECITSWLARRTFRRNADL